MVTQLMKRRPEKYKVTVEGFGVVGFNTRKQANSYAKRVREAGYKAHISKM